jgi:hypothetical protein
LEPGTYWWQIVASRTNERGPRAFLLSSRDIPDGVDPARLKALVAVSARRWGLHLAGWTARRAGVRDRVNVARDSVQFRSVARSYSSRYRVSQRCTVRRLNGVVVQRTCGPVKRRFVGEVLTDQDLVIRPDVAWAMDPARPAADEFDLESVLVHELGHLAGNKKHTARCTNSPMGPTLGVGEWWRTPHDWYRRGCAPSRPGDPF